MFKNASKWNKDTSEQYNIKFEYNRDKFIDLFNKVNFSDEANALFSMNFPSNEDDIFGYDNFLSWYNNKEKKDEYSKEDLFFYNKYFFYSYMCLKENEIKIEKRKKLKQPKQTKKATKPQLEEDVNDLGNILFSSIGFNNGLKNLNNIPVLKKKPKNVINIEKEKFTAIPDFECSSRVNSKLHLLIESKKFVNYKKIETKNDSKYQIAAQLIAKAYHCFKTEKDFTHAIRVIGENFQLFKIDYNIKYLENLSNGIISDDLIIYQYQDEDLKAEFNISIKEEFNEILLFITNIFNKMNQ